MLIDEQFRRVVAFLFVDVIDSETKAPKRVPAGTAFFVGVPSSVPDVSFTYCVTARHVVEATRPFGNLYVRINKASGGFDDYLASHDEWRPHPTTDVAVIPVGGLTDADVLRIPAEMLATDEYVEKKRIGIGDEVFFSGLFSENPGFTRNQPIVRFGNVALMPTEKIWVKLNPSSAVPDTQIDAYLVEARSWGGHSGSPTFIYFPPDRELGSIVVGSTEIGLLGLVHGHYEIKQDVAFIGDILGSGKVPVNAGMAVVVPASKILEVLNGDALMAQRNRTEEELKKRVPAPSPDVPLTKEDFEEALRRAARRRDEEQSDQGKS